MAEASYDEQLTSSPKSKDSPNGAAGPPSLSDISMVTTDDTSINLSSGDYNKGTNPSPRATKPNRTSATKSKLPAGARAPIKTTSASRPVAGDTPRRAKVPPRKNGNDDQPRQKCDMCEDVKVMKARCLNCQSSMCGDCNEHHRKMKICLEHELQDWDRYLAQQPRATPPIPPVPEGKQICKVHKGEKLQFYCKVCMTPLCINCKLTKHEGHRTRDIWEEIQEQREVLPAKLSQIRASFIPLMKQQLKDLEDYDKQLAYNVKGTVENIEKRTKVMKDEIDRASNNLVNKLRTKEKNESARIEVRKHTLNSYVKNATTALLSGERIIQSGDDFEVMELFQSLITMFKQMQDIMKRKTGKKKYIFQDGQLSKPQLQTMFGNYLEKGPKLQERPKVKRVTPTLQMVPEIHPMLLQTFKCKNVSGNKVSAIAPINDMEAWVSFGWTTNEVYLYNKDGFRKNKILFRQPVDDIAIDGNGNLLVSFFTGNIVRIVDKKMQVRDFFQCPLQCRGLAVSAAGEIIVSGVDQCTAHPPPTKCTIFKFTAKGNKTGHLDGDKAKKIPTHPYRVTENIDGSIAVSDWVNDKEGRVVVFSHDGKVRMVYYGNSNEHRNFLPYGIASDKYGHILVGDIINQEVHLLDIKGHFLRILLTRADLDGERPYSLAVDPMGLLWVGNERAQIKLFRYLVHQSHIVSQLMFRSVPETNWKLDFDNFYDEFKPSFPSYTRPDVATRWQMVEERTPRGKKAYRDIPYVWKWKY